ncbi:MAG: NAD-dependent DNA ligase LigA [Eubacteriaceae bacterium]
MDKKTEIEQLKEELKFHNKQYYELDSPKISDYDYDLLMKRLIEIEEKNPQYKTADSPSQRVGGKPLESFDKVEFNIPKLSLANAFNPQDLRDFDARVSKIISDYRYIVEYKFDGLTVVLSYKDGIFIQGATRGNGIVGENVTKNLKTINNIPLKINNSDTLQVRGEVYINKKDFTILNENRIREEKSLFANPRNAAAGSLRQLDSRMVASRPLDIFIFNLEEIRGKQFETHHHSLDYLKVLGFKVSPYKTYDNIEDIIDYCKEMDKSRFELPFEIDGLVIKIDNIEQRDELGNTTKNPRWAIAYKFPPEIKETKLLNINVQVGRTGNLTPVAELVPIHLSGSVVSRATLHNEDYIAEREIKIGDYVNVRKAGEIIPEVVNVNFDKRTGQEMEFKMPNNCPECGEPTYRQEGEAARKCINATCPAQVRRSIIHFVSKNAMNIEGLGSSLITKLWEKDFVKDPSDIYLLFKKRDELINLDKLGEKSIDKLIRSIDNSKNRSLDKLIFALGIPYIGEKSAKLLSENYENMEDLVRAREEELVFINEIGEKMANEIVNYFSISSNVELINRLKELGVNMTQKSKKKNSNVFDGAKFVLTGTLPNLKRDEAKNLIQENGGKIVASVSKNTDYVVAGEKPGSKYDKALQLGIKTINESQLLEIIGK